MKDFYLVNLSLKDMSLLREKMVALNIYEFDLLRLGMKSGLLDRTQKSKIHVRRGPTANIKKRFI